MTTEPNTAAPGMGEPTSAMLDAGLPHLIATKSDVRPLGQFYPGMTADESEEANQQYYGRDTVSGSMESHEAAKTYIRDWCPDHVKDYIASLEAQPAPVVGGDARDLIGQLVSLAAMYDQPLAKNIAERLDALLSARPGGDDDRILWGIVANAGRLSSRRTFRWAHVVDATGQGSNSSAGLCRRFGFDPDQQVGGDDDEAHPAQAGGDSAAPLSSGAEGA